MQHFPLGQNGLGLLFDILEGDLPAGILESPSDQSLHLPQIRDLGGLVVIHVLLDNLRTAQNGDFKGSFLHQCQHALGSNAPAAASDNNHIFCAVGAAILAHPGIGEGTGGRPAVSVIGPADLRPVIMDGQFPLHQLQHSVRGHVRLEVDELYIGVLAKLNSQGLGDTVESAVGIVLAFTGIAHLAIQEGGEEGHALPGRL